MSQQGWIAIAIPVCIFGGFIFAAEPEVIRPELATMEDWREPHCEWTVVKSAAGDPASGRWLKLEPGGGVLINGEKGKTEHLLSRFEHGDCELRIEFMIPKDSNSGIYFQDRYELQIKDSYGKTEFDLHDCGGIYQRRDRNRKPSAFEGRAPNVNASKPPGEWQSFQVTFRAPRFDASGKKIENVRFVKVVHNGITIHENVELSGPTQGGTDGEVTSGPLRFQGNHGPVAFRNIVVKPLNLD